MSAGILAKVLDQVFVKEFKICLFLPPIDNGQKQKIRDRKLMYTVDALDFSKLMTVGLTFYCVVHDFALVFAHT